MANYPIGVDEVGRGAWAGPLLVVAARQKGILPEGLADSKVLSKKQREKLFLEIKDACDIGEGWVLPEEIDELGLTKAMYLAVNRALNNLNAGFEEEIIMDGNIQYCPIQYKNAVCVVNADATHSIVSAASIYAKVMRDEHMTQAAKHYPGYGFEKNVGYGTKLHIDGLKLQSACLIHRRSYKPVRAYCL